jgi:putative ABC transport system ATP-binding protein
MAAVIELRDVTRHYVSGGARTAAVSHVDLTVEGGELVAVMGPSGSGKTTLLSLAGGLERPDEGRVTVLGRDLGSAGGAELDDLRLRDVGWLFQSPGLLSILTALENVALPLQLQGQPETQWQAAAQAALESVGLGDRSAHRTHELSGGEQHRVALARALAKAPRVLLADEPTAELDSETAESVAGLLAAAAASGIAVLVATHDETLGARATRVLTIEDGRLKD